jgi:hypothetical protein
MSTAASHLDGLTRELAGVVPAALDADVLVAAQALEEAAAIVTTSLKHFEARGGRPSNDQAYRRRRPSPRRAAAARGGPVSTSPRTYGPKT